MGNVDYHDIAADLDFDFNVHDRFECTLTLEADRFEVEVDELSFKWKAHDYLHVLFGKSENALTLDEYIPAHKRVFGTKSLISNLIDTQGYISSSVGVKAYKKYRKNTVPIAYFMQASVLTAHVEARIDLGFLYHFDGDDSYAGILAAYLPYFVHEYWLKESSKWQKHNFLVDIVWANHERSLVYGLEVTLGTNLLDPIGLISYPGEGDRSYFLGGDTYIGHVVKLGRIEWLPALRVSMLFPELTAMETYQLEVRWGNSFHFTDSILLHADGGMGMVTRYQGSDLYTRLNPLWSLHFMVKI